MREKNQMQNPAPPPADLPKMPAAGGGAVEGAAAPTKTAAPTLWTVGDLARYLRRGERSIFHMLKTPPNEPGSIPVVRLPGRALRFIPEQIQEWVRDGCPPAATFTKWHRRGK